MTKTNPMKELLSVTACCALLFAVAPSASQAAVFFSDNFSGGSTLNQPPAAPTLNSTSYQTAIGTTNASSNPSLGSGGLTVVFPSATGVLGETFARFRNAPVNLVAVGDYIDLTVVFINTSNILSAAAGTTLNANATLNIGLFNSGGVPPNRGQFALSTTNGVAGGITGGTEDWVGYFARVGYTGNSAMVTRPPQTPSGTSSQNQDLLFNNASSSQAFNSPNGANLTGSSPSATTTLVQGATNTFYLNITLSAEGTLTVSNALFAGVGTGGTILYSHQRTASGGTYLTGGFDGMAIGWRNNVVSGSPGQGSAMTITSVEVTGQITEDTTPPEIVTEPVNATVPSGGSCAFSVVAQSSSVMSYQWHRNGTNLANGGNISGANSGTLVISPASAADAASGANGYWVTVTDPGGSTNSVKCSLALGTASSLVWSGLGTSWDIGVSTSWSNGGAPATFNYGDSVTFNDSGSANLLVNLNGNYLAAASVTVDASSGVDYVFDGPGSFAGPGSLTYKGTGLLTIKNTNAHTGGTIISNSTAYLVLNNYNGLGSGPVILAKSGGIMEVVPAGAATTGIRGTVMVQDDFTIQFDTAGAFAGVFLGNLAGTAGKTLTLTPLSTASSSRFRVYGTATMCDANLTLNGAATSEAAYYGTTLAPYHSSGSQVYTGVISGPGGLIQRAGGLTVLTGQNTYSGGTTPTTGTIGFGADSIGNVSSGPIGTGPLFINPEAPGTTGSGTVLAFGGPRTIANPLQYSSGTNNQTLIIGGTNDLTFSGPFTLNGNDGATTFTNRLLQVANTGLTTISGPISGAGFGFTKSGAGTLALDGSNSYDGPTTNSAGTLSVNGTLAGPVTVASGATLAGTGTINGQTTVLAGGVVSPGNSLGALNLKGGLSLAGNLGIEVNRSGFASDKIIVDGTLANTGTGVITVTNLGEPLQAGDTFALFDRAVTGGGTLTITGAGVAVWTNKLALNGTIAVVVPLATTPTNLSYSVSGGNITLSWPPNYLTWILQSNSVGVASSASWFAVPGSQTNTQVVLPLNRSTPTVFFRLLQP